MPGSGGDKAQTAAHTICPMPIRFATLFRAMIVLVLAAHVFVMYSTARVMHSGFGLELDIFIIAALFALAMLIPLMWAAWLPELPEVLTQRRRHRRWQRGVCPRCGYDSGSAEPTPCPECGAPFEEPKRYELSFGTLRRFLILTVIAWGVGVASAELWITNDERSFAREVEQRRGQLSGEYIRQRAWPNDDSTLVYSAEFGMRAER